MNNMWGLNNAEKLQKLLLKTNEIIKTLDKENTTYKFKNIKNSLEESYKINSEPMFSSKIQNISSNYEKQILNLQKLVNEMSGR